MLKSESWARLVKWAVGIPAVSERDQMPSTDDDDDGNN
jgi:hypothetical protein